MLAECLVSHEDLSGSVAIEQHCCFLFEQVLRQEEAER